MRELRLLMQAQQSKLVEVQAEVAEGKFQLQEQKRELQLLKDYMLAMRNANPSLRILADQMEADEVRRWAETLPKARVLRWGGMISTPDTVLQVIFLAVMSWPIKYCNFLKLQAMIKRALSESGCPPHIIQDLMENTHERRWPPKLSSIEIRQKNRFEYEDYVCRKIPGKQAVVIMACDNSHLEADMILDPGLIVIFDNVTIILSSSP